MTDQPLAGLRVLELGTFVSAPYCGKLFAGYGADVIKVEPPGGDISRAHGPFPGDVPHAEKSALFLYLNTGKRSLELDVTSPAGKDAFLRLVATCDVVIENWRPADLRAAGLSYESLRAVNPAITVVSITPFGQTGPYSEYRATNLTAFAMGGQMFVTGTPEGGPLKPGGYQADYQGALHGFSAGMVALLAAERDGEGQHVDISVQRCMAPIIEGAISYYAYLGMFAPERKGNHMTSYIGIFPCRDGDVGVHVMSRNWKPFIDAIERPDIGADERFATHEKRIENAGALLAELHAWAETVEKKPIYARAGGMRAPISFVHTMADLLESPQLASRGYLRRVGHPVAGEAAYPGPPWWIGPDGWRHERAPLLGEHTVDVLREAGLSAAEVAAAAPSFGAAAR